MNSLMDLIFCMTLKGIINIKPFVLHISLVILIEAGNQIIKYVKKTKTSNTIKNANNYVYVISISLFNAIINSLTK